MFRTIVVGTDGSETASKAVGQAAELAANVGSTLLIVSAFAPVGPTRLREEASQAPDDVRWMVNPREDVDATLSGAAEVAEEQGADLIVVGNKGMTGAKRFLLGSVPNKVSHHAPCSVLIVRTT